MSPQFTSAPDAVDPAVVPRRLLHTGATMPGLGIGTFGSDRFSTEEVAAAVSEAIRSGYRFIDCAAVYLNEDAIGTVLKGALDDGLSRDELFVVSKVWNDKHSTEDVIASCKKTLQDLQLDYLDAYLVHWPFRNYHRPFAHGGERNPDSRPYDHARFMETWRAMEELVDAGLVRHIGTSNVTIPKLKMILQDARIAPAISEMELHPTCQQSGLFQFCLDHDIQPVGFSPIGSPRRPDRDVTVDDLVDIEQPVVVEIARRHGVHPALVCLKWAVQRGQVPIPFSVARDQFLGNLRSTTEDPLTGAEMEALKSVERNNRLIKGQVFLWEGAESWLDLWDVDGSVTGRTADAKDGNH